MKSSPEEITPILGTAMGGGYYAGRILIDGQDVVHVAQDSLRAQIGMVTQDTSLLHRSVRENILYGRPDADDDEAGRPDAAVFVVVEAAIGEPEGEDHEVLNDERVSLRHGLAQGDYHICKKCQWPVKQGETCAHCAA